MNDFTVRVCFVISCIGLAILVFRALTSRLKCGAQKKPVLDDGEFIIDTTDNDKDIFRIELNSFDFENKEYIMLKVVKIDQSQK